MEPLVSVIIPVYNVLPYLHEAIDSVIHQTYQNLEIIIVDDGSTDGSGTVCDEYKEFPRIQVIHQENRGLSGARNTGLESMTGDYVAFLDSDDAFCPNMIEEMMGYVHHYQTDIVACGYDTIETEGFLREGKVIGINVYPKDTVLSAREAFIDLLEGKYSAAAWNKVYHRRIWDGIRFPEGHVYEDQRIIPRVMEKCERVAIVSGVLMHYRIRAGSITHTYSEINIRDNLLAKKQLLAFAEHMQWSIPPQSMSAFRECNLRFLIFAWADLRREEKRTKTGKLSKELKKNLHQLANDIGRIRQTRTKMAWWLFQYCPGIISLAHRQYQKLKNLVHDGF